jgi:hypothetical protein
VAERAVCLNSGKPEGRKRDGPAVRPWGVWWQSTIPRPNGPLSGSRTVGAWKSIPGLAPLGFRVPAFLADVMRVSGIFMKNLFLSKS